MPSSIKWVPSKYMLRGVKWLLDRGGAGLWFDPGLRKTSITLAAISALKRAKNMKSALVVAPLRVAEITWPGELTKWTDFNHLTYNLYHGPRKTIELGTDITLVNPEGLHSLLTNARSMRGAWPWDVLVVDESTKFKNWTAQRTKLLRSYLNNFDRRWTLTGTPAPNGLGDVFSQVYLMDGGAALGKFITQFRNRFMVQGGYLGYEWLPRKGAWDEVADAIAHLVLRLEARDYLSLPDCIPVDIPVKLPPKARRIYDELEREFYLKVDKGEVVAANAAVLGTKLRQATNGSLYMTTGEPTHVHDAKLEALGELLEELNGSPLLIAVGFLPEVEAIRKAYGKDIPYLGGGVSRVNAALIVSRWNEGKLPSLLVHPSSVAHGLNLQENAHHLCWYGLTWNLEEYDQLIKRLHRSGQKRTVIVHHIMAQNTMDQVIVEGLKDKDRTQSGLLKRIKEHKTNLLH